MSSSRGVPAPTHKGAYGTIFYNPDGTNVTYGTRKQADYDLLSKTLYEQSVREAIPPPHPSAWDDYVKLRGSLYQSGTETPLVIKSLIADEYAKNNPTFDGTIGVSGETYIGRGSYPRPNKPETTPVAQVVRTERAAASSKKIPEVTGSAALFLADHRPGGAYHVTLQQEPYSPPLRAERHPLGSAHLTSTPGQWPIISKVDKSFHKHHQHQHQHAFEDDDGSLGSTAWSSLGERLASNSAGCSKSVARQQSVNAAHASTLKDDSASLGSYQSSLAESSLGPHSYSHSHSHLHRQSKGSGSSLGYLDPAPRNTNASLLMQAVASETCGRIGEASSIGSVVAAATEGAISRALKKERGAMKKHAKWLQNDTSRPAPRLTKEEVQSQSKSSVANNGLHDDASSVTSKISRLSLDDAYDMSTAGLSYSQRTAKVQQGSMQSVTADATRALGEYKYEKKREKDSGSSRRNEEVAEDEEGEEWRSQRNARRRAGGNNLVNDESSSSIKTGQSTKQSKKGAPRGSLVEGVTPSIAQLQSNNDTDSIASSRYSGSNHTRYGEQLAHHLDAATASSGNTGGIAGSLTIPRNPFRPLRHRELQCINQAKPVNALNPLEYKPSMRVSHSTAGHLTIVVRPEKTLENAIPSQDEVYDALGRVTRRAILAYDTRIVETATLCKALSNPVHPTPGLSGIFDLHAAFVTAGALNPNPWQLKRSQVEEVIRSKIYWLPPEVAKRLVSAYDSTASGVIRFVRLTVALVCCCNPGLAILITTLARLGEEKEAKAKVERERNAMRKRLLAGQHLDRTQEASQVNFDPQDSRSSLERAHDAKVQRERDHEHAAELFLIKLIHSLYEDCEGSVPSDVYANKPAPYRAMASPDGLGIRLEDVIEALSSCASCIEDELEMASCLQPVIQELYYLGQSRDETINQDGQTLPLDELKHSQQLQHQQQQQSSHHTQSHGQGLDDMSVGSSGSSTLLSSNFSALSRFTPHSVTSESAPLNNTAQTPYTPHKISRMTSKARGTAYLSGANVGTVGATAQDRDRIDKRAKRAAEAWRAKQGLGRDGVELGSRSKFDYADAGTALHGESIYTAGEGSLLLGGESTAWRSDAMSIESEVTNPSRHQHQHQYQRWQQQQKQLGSSVSASRLLPNGRLAADTLLTHNVLKSSARVPRVSQTELIEVMLRHPQALKEFVRQLKRFRGLCMPFEIHGSVAYTEARANPTVPYGKMNL